MFDENDFKADICLLEDTLSKISRLPKGDYEYDCNHDFYEYGLFLKMVFFLKRRIADGETIHRPLGFSRFIGDWNFEDEIVNIVYRIENRLKDDA